MRRQLYEQIMEFTKKCQADPLFALLFLTPAENTLSEESKLSYRRVIPRPMDLTIIFNNLRQEIPYYKTVQEWANDFRLIFENTIEYDAFVGTTWITGIAQHYQHKLHKFLANLTFASDAAYAARLGTAYARYLELLARPPGGSGLVSAQRPIEECDGSFQEHTLSLLTKRLNKLIDAGGEAVGAEIAALLPPEMTGGEGELSVDVGALSAQNRKVLWDFVQKKERELDE
jgi:hypothetical protein